MIQIFVPGLPTPQGSMKGYVVNGRARLTSDNPGLKSWRVDVKSEALKQCATPLGGPVGVEICFYLPRPKSAPKRVVLPAKKPDIDKLARAVLDALTGVAFVDDGQVVELIARKYFTGADFPIGAQIWVVTNAM